MGRFPLCTVCARPEVTVENRFSPTPTCAGCRHAYYRLRGLTLKQLQVKADELTRQSRLIYAAKHGLQSLKEGEAS